MFEMIRAGFSRIDTVKFRQHVIHLLHPFTYVTFLFTFRDNRVGVSARQSASIVTVCCQKEKFANMAPRYERVILCCGSSEKNDSYESYVKTLKTAGYMCEYLYTLGFEFVNISELKSCLLSPSSYYGLILTSRRAVEAIKLASMEDVDILQSWKALPVYCVGPATEAFAKSHLGSENCFGKEAGNAKELAELLIASVANKSAPLLYPCSEISRETIEKTLTESDIKVKKLIVYKTLRCESLERELSKFMDNTPKIFVFFSPSTVEYVVCSLKKKSYDVNNIKAVAIGPVTGQALLDAGLKVFAIANKPNPISLLEAVNDAEKCEVERLLNACGTEWMKD